MAEQYQQGDIVQDAQGNRLQLSGAEWRPLAAPLTTDQQRLSELTNLEALVAGAGARAQQYIGGAQQMLQGHPIYGQQYGGQDRLAAARAQQVGLDAGGSPWATAGQMAVDVAPALLTRGIGSSALLGGAQGALIDPENPVESGLFGAALGGAAGALGMGGAGRMADRVTGRLARADAQATAAAAETGERNLKGFLQPGDEAAAGLPLTQGDAAALQARAGREAQGAEQLRRAEELRSTDPMFGGGVRTVRDEQQRWLTSRVQKAIGLDGETALTPARIGESFTRLGGQFDDFAKKVFPKDGIDPANFDQALPMLEVRYGPMGIPPQVEKIMAKLDDGPITYTRFHDVGRELDNLAKTAKSRGNLEIMGAARDAKESMLMSLEGMIGKVPKQEYEALRRKYAILKSLAGRNASIDASGQVNARSLQAALRGDRAPWKFVMAGDDPLMRAVDTVSYLQTKVVPSSGTAERLLANPGRTAVTGAQALGLGGAGMLGYNQVFGR